MGVRGRVTRWRWTAGLCLAGGPAAAALLWGMAMADAPGRVSGFRAALTVLPSLVAGLVAGCLALASLVLRETVEIGSSLLGAAVHVARLAGVRSGPREPVFGRTGRRWSGALMAGAWLVLGLDAAFLYLTLF